ncbi:MAG TPA: kelch repeat-containing protein, partial [Chloroflexia bacterium]|nr:kelch repeat-containing protein [Chloroflexia bacterium]
MGADRWLVFACCTVAVLAAVLLLGSGVRAAASRQGPPAAPLTCGQQTWTTQTPYPVGVYSQATAALNGMLYSFGGFSPGDISNAYRYDPGTDQWTAIASLIPARDGASAVSDGTSIYILGGSTAGNPNTTLQRYNPATNDYTNLAAIPHFTTRATAVVLNGKIYVVNGFNSANTVDIYDIATNTWGTSISYPQGYTNANSMVLNGSIYVAGGDLGGFPTDKTYRLDPSTGTWDDAAIADLPG